ncbi:hypothetical protein M407DRAFT_245952 [Tulasnella calospora MUT 4182]|uniref:Protein kinase domain-containing protein n=1 Tax=Tulasnella calospora MUT 4182 TaxID=1051891 RepID=A0A0C3Q7Q1_9AGAM|nr:hypothetical protein M407DRAFT_245952 [Tulasnella calospora MUT 4182]
MKDYYEFVTQLVEGFAFMHEHGIAHRNFNERNIVARWTGLDHQWLIADYELSVLVHVPGPRTTRPSTLRESKSFTTLGRRYDPSAADIRSLGSTIESLTSALSKSSDPQWFRAPEGDYMLLLGEMQVLDPKIGNQPTITTVQRRVSSNFYPPNESALSQCISYIRGASETVVARPDVVLGAAAGLLATQRYFVRR